MDFSTHDICLVYENKTFIDIKDLYSKLKNNFFLKLWYEDYLEIYSIYNKKTTDELNVKFIIKNDKLCIILIIEKIDVNEVFKDLLRKDNLKLNKFEVIDFNSNFNSTYEKWSGATFNVLLNRVNEYLIESSGFISLK